MTEVDEVEWPTEALEPAAIGDQLADEGFERGITADDQVPGVMTYGVEYWERGKLGPLRLCGTDIPGSILFLIEPEPEAVQEEPTPLFGDWGTPADELPSVEELAAKTDPEDVAFLDELEARLDDDAALLAVAEERVRNDTGQRVTLDDVAGIFGPDWTGGMDSVEWVRAQRDD